LLFETNKIQVIIDAPASFGLFVNPKRQLKR